MKIIIVVALVLIRPSHWPSNGRRRSVMRGREIGRSTTDARGNTIYRDASGRNTGRSVTSGGNTTFYDAMGRRTSTTKGR